MSSKTHLHLSHQEWRPVARQCCNRDCSVRNERRHKGHLKIPPLLSMTMAIAMIGSIVATGAHSTWGASWWLRGLIFVSFQESSCLSILLAVAARRGFMHISLQQRERKNLMGLVHATRRTQSSQRFWWLSTCHVRCKSFETILEHRSVTALDRGASASVCKTYR